MFGSKFPFFSVFTSFLARPSAVPVCDPKRTVTGTAGPAACGAPGTWARMVPRNSLSHWRCSGEKGALSGIWIGEAISLGVAGVAGRRNLPAAGWSFKRGSYQFTQLLQTSKNLHEYFRSREGSSSKSIPNLLSVCGLMNFSMNFRWLGSSCTIFSFSRESTSIEK